MTGPQHHTPDRLYCLRELNTMALTDWETLPVTHIPLDHLTPTQNSLLIDRLIDITNGQPRDGGDTYGHTVHYNGRLYIHDGHHDWALRWLRGEQTVPVRVKRITTACVDPCECQG